MPERGETFFHPNPRHPSFEEQNPSRQHGARKGGDVFPQNTKFGHVASLINKLSIKVPQKGGKPLLSQPASRATIRYEGGGRCFSNRKHNPNERRLGRQQLTSRRTRLASNNKGVFPCRKQPLKRSFGMTARRQGGRRFSPKTKSPRESPGLTSPEAH